MVKTFSPQSHAFLSTGLNDCTLTKYALFACLLSSGFFLSFFLFVFLFLFLFFSLTVVEGAELCLWEYMKTIRS